MEWLTSIDWFALWCWAGALILIAAGFAGTIIPAIPGLPLIAVGAWLIGWAGDFQEVGWKTIAFLGVLAVIGVVVDTVAQTAGAQRAGASKEGILGSLIGTVVGVFLGGIVGILIMPLIGAAIGEFWAKRDLLHAGRVGLATWIGMIIGTVVKVALAFTMTGTLLVVHYGLARTFFPMQNALPVRSERAFCLGGRESRFRALPPRIPRGGFVRRARA